jgi:hypothetical protein
MLCVLLTPFDQTPMETLPMSTAAATAPPAVAVPAQVEPAPSNPPVQWSTGPQESEENLATPRDRYLYRRGLLCVFPLSNFDHSDVEGPPVAHMDKKKKDRSSKLRRKKQEAQRMPRLCIIDVQHKGEVVECSLETGKHSTVSFKFNRDDDQPEDIASNLVCLFFPMSL